MAPSTRANPRGPVRGSQEWKLSRKLDEEDPPMSWREWLEHKHQQYNITSVLYMLDWWERLLFNMVMLCVLLGTVFTMYVYSHTSIPLFALSAFLLGFIVLLVLLCPLHQY
mmetsp:Transcript_55441/g.131664  ORF Transcript_55441/g.131664 Transcript_55441/m.131664 type:complete len:111 (-) Transcript_55441:39-371(-)